MRKTGWILWGCALIMVFAGLFLSGHREKEALSPGPLAEKGEIKVYAGAPKGKIHLEKEELPGDTFHVTQVSPLHPLKENFSVPPVRGVKQVVGPYFPCEEGVLLSLETIQALCDMKKDGMLEGIRVEEGAVSFGQQEAKRKEAVERYGQVYPWKEAVKRACFFVPGGGESEHQLGTAADISLMGPLEVGKTDPLLRSPAGKKLAESMWKYGFIRRFSPGAKEEGNCENLHLRFVGGVHAGVMEAGKWSLEKYMDVLWFHGALTVHIYNDIYYIYSFPENQEMYFLPSFPTEQGPDNLGNRVFVCREKGRAGSP